MSKLMQKIFILHGWAVHQQSDLKWQKCVDELASAGVMAEVLKIPGLSAPLDEVWNLDRFVTWLASELPSDRPSIVLGHSFGGQIVTRFAAKHPERVSKLILVDSAGVRDRSLKARVKRSSFWVLAKIGKIFFTQEWVRNLLYKVVREQDYRNAPPLLRRTMSTILDDEVLADLPKVAAPTLLIWGENDKVTPLWMGRKILAGIAGSQIKIVPAARHSPQYTHPQVVAKFISEFLGVA